MRPARPSSRPLLPRAALVVLALLGWLWADAAAVAHIGVAGGCARDGCCAHAPAARSCGDGHTHRHAHDHDAEPPTSPSPDGDDRAPGHPTDGCALCAHAAMVVGRAAQVVALPPVGAATACVGARPPSVRPSARFEPGLARGPPVPARS